VAFTGEAHELDFSSEHPQRDEELFGLLDGAAQVDGAGAERCSYALQRFGAFWSMRLYVVWFAK
jgi:hypothetical protein